MANRGIDKSELLFDNRYLVKLIIPLLIETLLNVTIGMMDTIMVSTDGEAVVSGVSLVDSLANLFVFVFSAFATGGAVVCEELSSAPSILEEKTGITRHLRQNSSSIFPLALLSS